jgi:outer membrane immunogenic protein
MKARYVIALLSAFVNSGLASAQPAPPVLSGSASSTSSGWQGGAQLGYNWQNGSFVYGFEADISALDLHNRTNTMMPAFLPNATATTTSAIDWYGTVRGRLGWATGPLMIYGTAGLAYGKVNLNSTLIDNGGPTSLNNQISSLKTGWVAGAGLEYLIQRNLVLNLGYQYVDLGSTSLAGVSPNQTLQQSIRSRGQFQVVSVGASWLFAPNADVVVNDPKFVKAPYSKAPLAAASPWAGVYAGGHVGGAWGNRTDANYTDSVGVIPSDSRLKRDIHLVGHRDDGLGIYSYRYLWSSTVYVGVMAQEVALIHPDAVVRSELDDYLRVNYSRIGMTLMTLSEWEDKPTAY